MAPVRETSWCLVVAVVVAVAPEAVVVAAAVTTTTVAAIMAAAMRLSWAAATSVPAVSLPLPRCRYI
jgi:hypothetical protein